MEGRADRGRGRREARCVSFRRQGADSESERCGVSRFDFAVGVLRVGVLEKKYIAARKAREGVAVGDVLTLDVRFV